MHWKRRLSKPAFAVGLLIAVGGTVVLLSGVAGAQGIKPGGASYLYLAADPAVPGGVQTHQSAVVDIRSSQSRLSMEKEGLTVSEINLVRARAQGLTSCTMAYGEFFWGMSEGSPVSTIIKNVRFEDSQDKQGTPAWCETVVMSSSSTHPETPVVTTTTNSDGSVTTTTVNTTFTWTQKTVVRLLVVKACGNIGLISTSTSTSHHASVSQTSTTTPAPPPPAPPVPPAPPTPPTPPPTPPTPPPAPAFSCSSLSVNWTSGNSVEASADYVSNETPTTVSFQWSNSGSDDVTTAGTISTAGTATASYTYQGGPGTYTVTATVNAAGTDSTGPTTCTAKVTVPCPQTPPPCQPVVPPCQPTPPVVPPCNNPQPPCAPSGPCQHQPCGSSNGSPCHTHQGGQNGNSPCSNSQSS